MTNWKQNDQLVVCSRKESSKDFTSHIPITDDVTIISLPYYSKMVIFFIPVGSEHTHFFRV